PEDDGPRRTEVRRVTVPLRAPGRLRAGRAAAARWGTLGRGELLGHDGVGGTVGHELFGEPDSGREHRRRQPVGGGVRGRDADRRLVGGAPLQRAAAAAGRLPVLRGRGPALDLRLFEDGAAGEGPRPRPAPPAAGGRPHTTASLTLWIGGNASKRHSKRSP